MALVVSGLILQSCALDVPFDAERWLIRGTVHGLSGSRCFQRIGRAAVTLARGLRVRVRDGPTGDRPHRVPCNHRA